MPENEAINIEQLAKEIASKLNPRIPIEVDLWDTRIISTFLKRSEQVTRERIVCLPSFPKAIRLPSKKGKAHPLWKAQEVIDWADRHIEGSGVGRPRKG